MTLRWRWALTLGGVTALVALVFLIASGFLTARELRAATDADLEQRLELLDEGVVPGSPRPPFEPGRRRRQVVNLDAEYRVIGPDGVIVVEAADPDLPISEGALAVATGQGLPTVFESVRTDLGRYRLATAGIPIDGPGPNLGAVQIAVQVDQLDDSIEALFLRTATLGLMMIAIAASAGWILAGKAVAPLEQLTSEAERIAATEDLSVSIEPTGTDEIGRLAGAFSAMIMSLKTSREKQQLLVADAGHEFRTPLTALRTNLETLQRRKGELTDEQSVTLLDAALAESIELTDLASELVELTRDARNNGEETQVIDLKEVATLVAERFASRTDDAVLVEGVGTDVEIRIGQIERVITNLIGNAVTWNQPGDPIAVIVDGGTLWVRDHGPGIRDEDLPLVFERFYRSAEARTNPGSGLGLSIVRHIVEGHGGTVFARNHPDGGAEVGFDLSPM